MKKYKIYIYCLVTALLFSTCGEDWLQDISPKGQLLETNYYQTDEEIYAGLIAAYSMFKTKYFKAWSSWYMQASVLSDDSRVHGGGRSDRPEYWQFADYKTSPDNTANQETWDRCYYGAYRCGLLINNLDPDTDFKKEVIAEARFLRAWFYFDIVRFWGEAPLITETLTPSEAIQPKASIGKIYNQIIDDLKLAIPDLPEKRSGLEKFRITSYAAHGLLGKVYLYMASPYYNTWGDLGNATDLYSQSATEFAAVVVGPYKLEENYDTIWSEANEWNQESILEVDYYPANGNGWDDGSANPGNIDVQLCGVRGAVTGEVFAAGWGFDMIPQATVDVFRQEGDSVRLHGTALAEWQIKQLEPNAILEKNEGYTGYFTKKRQVWAKYYSGVNWGWGNNERVLRLGDVFLMYAEALLQSGNTAEAQKYFDKIRERAKLGTKTISLENIKLERRLELTGEGHRFFDLVRWGDAATVLAPLGFRAGVTEHYPIPQRDIDASNGVLKQRKGY
jgi:starch-binding outer membrane protein, SusD/RagB family